MKNNNDDDNKKSLYNSLSIIAIFLVVSPLILFHFPVGAFFIVILFLPVFGILLMIYVRSNSPQNVAGKIAMIVVMTFLVYIIINLFLVGRAINSTCNDCSTACNDFGENRSRYCVD